MSDLLGSLSMAARSMAAQQAGLDTTGQNIANINEANARYFSAIQTSLDVLMQMVS